MSLALLTFDFGGARGRTIPAFTAALRSVGPRASEAKMPIRLSHPSRDITRSTFASTDKKEEEGSEFIIVWRER